MKDDFKEFLDTPQLRLVRDRIMECVECAIVGFVLGYILGRL